MAAPDHSFPTVYVDGITSSSNTNHVVKLYFARIDGDTKGIEGPVQNEVLQIVFPMDNFLQSVAFLVTMVDNMVKQGIVKDGELQKNVDAIRNRIAPPPA